MGTIEHCLVVCAGSVSPAAIEGTSMPQDTLIIAADGGYLRCAELGFIPDLIVGDFDSAPVPPPMLETQVFPSHKDDTDCMLALREGLRRGCTHFTLLGATGGRLDHTLASIQSLAWLATQGATGVLLDETTSVRLLTGPATLMLPQRPGYLSVFALGDRCGGVTLSGVEYPLKDYTLENTFPLGVSNRITEPHASISVLSGRLLVMTVTEDTPPRKEEHCHE